LRIEYFGHGIIDIFGCSPINFEKGCPIQIITYGLVNGLIDFKVIVIGVRTIINKKLSIRFIDLEHFGFDEVLFG
jgi:hypothetical protein